MTIRGGDIREFRYAGRAFDVHPDADVTLFLSGFDLTNQIAGNGEHIATGKRRGAGLDGLLLSLDDARKDLEFLVNIQTGMVPKPYSITLISGITYLGTGLPEGEGLGKTTAAGTGTLAIRGKTLEQA